MKSKPEKGNASGCRSPEASSVKNPVLTQGINMPNSTALTIANTSVRQVSGLFSLNDLHKASGGEDKHQPAKFVRMEQTQALIAEIENSPKVASLEAAEIGNPEESRSLVTKEGRGGGTYACKELVIAYAAWISAAFHLKVIRVFLSVAMPAAVERNPAIDYDRISPAQAQDLKEIVDAIVKAGMQGFGETWKRFQNKFKVNSYLELPATRHLEAREYLIAKLPKSNAETVVEEQPAAPSLFGRQWLVSTDMAGKETVRPVAPDQFVKSYREIARGIAVGDLMPSTAELVDLASACNQRLAQRLGNPALVLAV